MAACQLSLSCANIEDEGCGRERTRPFGCCSGASGAAQSAEGAARSLYLLAERGVVSQRGRVVVQPQVLRIVAAREGWQRRHGRIGRRLRLRLRLRLRPDGDGRRRRRRRRSSQRLTWRVCWHDGGHRHAGGHWLQGGQLLGADNGGGVGRLGPLLLLLLLLVLLLPLQE